MCGRFVSHGSRDKIAEAFTIEAGESPPRYNIAPSQEVAAVQAAGSGQGRQLASLRWGLVPVLSKDPLIGHQLINARAETVQEKPAFRTAIRQRRCLIPASGFYEWAAAGKKKQPYYFMLKAGKPFAFAGLWERWEGGGEEILSCTIITTQANDVLRPYHHRMPVIIPASSYDYWLDPDINNPAEVEGLLVPYPSWDMTAFPVSTRVNSPKIDDPQCIAPLSVPPALF